MTPELSPLLSEEALRELESAGEVVPFADGDVLVEEGETDYPFHAVLDGKVRVTKQFGREERVLAVHERGNFIGDISVMTGGAFHGRAQAQGDGRAVRIERERFRQLAASDSPLARTVLAAMACRSQDVEAQTRQQEKLSALGKMAAGMAHELNNPAAAAKRSAVQLREAVKNLQEEAVRCDCRLSPEQREAVIVLSRKLTERREQHVDLDPLARSDREEEMADWMERHMIEDGWDVSAALAGAGLTLGELDELVEVIDGVPLRGALAWLQAGLQLSELAMDVEASTSRISELVQVMKDYSYMDQAPFQELDVRHGLESTLRMFGHQLRGRVELVREYAPDTPKICAYGSELNQVWTNLIDNALDAMEGGGRLTVRTEPADDGVLVEIIDTGAGIPEDVQERVFEPFFTTKDVGEGTGLGLDISYRIVTNRHGGNIQLNSKPGETRFQVFLPRNPPRQEG